MAPTLLQEKRPRASVPILLAGVFPGAGPGCKCQLVRLCWLGQPNVEGGDVEKVGEWTCPELCAPGPLHQKGLGESLLPQSSEPSPLAAQGRKDLAKAYRLSAG